MATNALISIVRRVYLNGTTISPGEHGRLVYSGSPLPVALQAEVNAYEPSIHALLIVQGIGEEFDRGWSPAPRRYLKPAGCLTIHACRHLGPCSEFLMGERCDHSTD